MAITPNFTPAQVAKVLQQKVDAIDAAIFDRLSNVGEKFVTNARNNHTYKDDTGALTSSMNYVILKDGVQLKSNFEGNNAKGVAKGREVANQVAQEHPKGWVLIVVAGMEYAAAVESKNRDVLTASSITAENDLKKAIASLSKKLA